ncbi:MAG: hypothetical protein KAR20_27075 [Candidatus Heimdallarchaeota archaeon]|nr:hypothetical protein [Candidatus Heimdallarchaeota archaeon]
MRESVRWFAKEMEKVLKKNDYKHGWSSCTRQYLFASLNSEIFELFSELKPLEYDTMNGAVIIDSQKVIRECCDIANFAMMIADNQRDEI